MTHTHFLNCNIWPHNGGDGMDNDLCSCGTKGFTTTEAMSHIKEVDPEASIDLSISGYWFVQARIYQYEPGGLPEGKTCYHNTPEDAVLAFFAMLRESGGFLSQPLNHREWEAWDWYDDIKRFAQMPLEALT